MKKEPTPPGVGSFGVGDGLLVGYIEIMVVGILTMLQKGKKYDKMFTAFHRISLRKKVHLCVHPLRNSFP